VVQRCAQSTWRRTGPVVEVLKISIGCPYLEFHITINIMEEDDPFVLRMNLTNPYGTWIPNCKFLTRHEVDLLHDGSCTYAGEIFVHEYLEKARPETMAAMGEGVLKTVTTTISTISGGVLNSYHDRVRQLLNWELIYIKDTKTVT
jgi:hypothetical protein